MTKKLQTNIWNLSQNLLTKLNRPPRACHYPHNPIFCAGCEPGMLFECNVCGRLMPYCMGADDDLPDACDDCYSEAPKRKFGKTVEIDKKLQ